jgi:hypothetical protein
MYIKFFFKFVNKQVSNNQSANKTYKMMNNPLCARCEVMMDKSNTFRNKLFNFFDKMFCFFKPVFDFVSLKNNMVNVIACLTALEQQVKMPAGIFRQQS